MKTTDKIYVENLLKTYEPKTTSKIEELKALDKQAKKGAYLFSFIFGTIGSLILGTGMSIAMGLIFKELFVLGIIVGIIGIIMVSINYFIFKKLLELGKRKYANQIKKLSDEILNS